MDITFWGPQALYGKRPRRGRLLHSRKPRQNPQQNTRTHACTHARTHARMHARTHARTEQANENEAIVKKSAEVPSAL
eukprot:4588286-Amphidinium_carterae.1